MSPRGPSRALKSQTTAFKKPEKTRWFLMFLGPETSQETLKKPKSRPRSTQRAPKARKKSTKKNQDKCLRGKNALSWRSQKKKWEPFLEPLSAHF